MKHLYLLLFLLISTFAFSQQGPGEIEGLRLYPNPVTHGKVFIHTAQNAPKQVHIFDVLGTMVLETTILGKEVNLGELDAGVYVIRVFEKDKVATRKLIIK